MFALAVNDLAELKNLSPQALFEGMPISVTNNGFKCLYIWWADLTETSDDDLVVELIPPTNQGRFKKVFNKSISSSSVPIGNPTPEQVGTYWVDTSVLTVYLACSFVINEIRQYRWIQLTNSIGSK